jgi:hypothetical protein
MSALAQLAKIGVKGTDALVDALRSAKKFVAPQDEALKLAQQRAALPVEKGGLGLGPANTAMERAAAMGFDTPVYHGTKSDFAAINPSRGGEYGGGVYVAKDPNMASQFASYATGNVGENVIPMLTNAKNALVTADRNVPRAIGVKKLMKKGYDSIEGIGSTGDVQNVILSPESLRSISAAFDPWRKTAAVAATMGVAAPNLLAEELRKK